MKIAILTEGISTKSGLRVTYELAIALSQLGHNIYLISPKTNLDTQTLNKLKKTSLKIYLLKEKNLLPKILEIRKILLKLKPDIISAHCYPSTLVAAKLSGIPIVWTYYGTQLNVLQEHFFPYQSPLTKLLDLIVNLYIKSKIFLMASISNSIIAISHATKIELKKLYGKTANSTILFGSLPTNFNKPLPNPRPSTSTPQLLLTVSRITPYKGFHHLIKIVNNLAQEFPGLKLIVVGSAPLPNYLSYLKKLSGKNIQIKENISDYQLSKLYQKATIYLSADKYLFYGLPIWEASSYSIPTVALNYQAASEAVIHGKTGYLTSTPPLMQKYLKKLLKNPKLAQKFGKNAKHLASQRTWKKTAIKYEKIINKLIS